MKAAVKEVRSKGITVKDIPVPGILEDEVLVKVKRGAICGTDIHLYHWNAWCENVNAKNPMVIGHEYAGRVVEVGKSVKSLKVGDLVAAETHIPCGTCMMCRTGNEHICQNMRIIGVHTDGAFAEYTVLPEACAWRLPNDLDPAVGAIYEPFGIAVHGVTKDLVAGVPTVVTGCGPIGLFAVGVAKASGASKVFAVDIKSSRLELAGKMGADHVINSLDTDPVEFILDHTGGLGAGALIELSGNGEALRAGLKSLRKGGWAALIGLFRDEVSLDLVNGVIYKEATLYGLTGREMYKSWYLAEEFLASGRIDVRPVITHRFPLERVEDAILLAESGEAGKIIIDVE